MSIFKKYYSLLVSTFLIIIYVFYNYVINNNHLNNDAILYLRLANIFANSPDSFVDNFHIHNWPYYSLLISFISETFKISILLSSQLINFIFSVLTLFTILVTVKNISENKNNYLLTSILIICFSYLISDYIPMIIRDHGMWFFSIVGVFSFLKFIDTGKSIFIVASIGLFFMGFFFRPESIIFILGLFFFTIYYEDYRKKLFNIKFLSIFLIFFICLFLYLISLGQYTHLEEIIERTISMFSNIYSMPLFSDNLWLSKLLVNEGFTIKLLITFGVFFKKLIISLGIPAFITYFIYRNLMTVYKNNQILQKKINFLFIIFLINSILALLNFYATYVLSSRYLLFGTLISIVLSASILNIHINNLGSIRNFFNNNKFVSFLLLFIFLINVLFDVLLRDRKYTYEMKVSNWVLSQNFGFKDIYINDRKLGFYITNEFIDVDNSVVNIENYKNYDLFVLKKPIKNHFLNNNMYLFEVINIDSVSNDKIILLKPKGNNF